MCLTRSRSPLPPAPCCAARCRCCCANAWPPPARAAPKPPGQRCRGQDLGPDAQARFINLKAWRSEVAKAHDLPAYVIFNDATLVGIAQRNPQTLADLHGISGIGAKKLEAYGAGSVARGEHQRLALTW